MCLGIIVRHPHRLLSRGTHAGFDWVVVHNDSGYRCGYVRVPAGHPWHGKHYDEIDAEVHGGLTFSDADEPCDGGKPDDGHWFGFDCSHCFDAIDPDLPFNCFGDPVDDATKEQVRQIFLRRNWPGMTLKDTPYVEAECRSLCEQAAAASVPFAEDVKD